VVRERAAGDEQEPGNHNKRYTNHGPLDRNKETAESTNYKHTLPSNRGSSELGKAINEIKIRY